MDQHEAVPELRERPDEGEVRRHRGCGEGATEGDATQRPQPGAALGHQRGPDDRHERGEEDRLPGQRGQGDRDAGPPPTPSRRRQEREGEQEHHRGLLARTPGGVGDDARDAHQQPGGDDAGQPVLVQVAAEEVDDPHADHREHQEEHPHAEQVVGADQPGRGRPEPGDQVRQRPGAVHHADVRRHPVGDLLPGVRVEAEVAGEVPVEAVDDEHPGRRGGDPDADHIGSAHQEAGSRSTSTGAWSEAPCPARSSRSMNAWVTRPASEGEPRMKSMRRPRFRSKRCR